jgi:hypothetical protein
MCNKVPVKRIELSLQAWILIKQLEGLFVIAGGGSHDPIFPRGSWRFDAPVRFQEIGYLCAAES